jgi:PAS domain S-box-containing protein/putative nucleotidyltransferase with HDIG domain
MSPIFSLSDAILETMGEAMLVVTADNRVNRINRAAAELYAVRTEDVIGWNLPQLIGTITEEVSAVGLETVMHGQVWRGVVWHQRPNGTRFRASLAVHHLNAEGVFVAIVQDVTAREEAAQRQAVLTRALGLIAEAAEIEATIPAVLTLLSQASGASAAAYRVREGLGYSLKTQVGLEVETVNSALAFASQEDALERGEVVTLGCADGEHFAPHRRHGLSSVHLVGQRVAGRLVGTVQLAYADAPRLDLRAILPEIANALGANLERHQQWLALARRNRLLELLNRIDRLSLDAISVQSLLLGLKSGLEEVFGAAQIRIGHLAPSEASVTWLGDTHQPTHHPSSVDVPATELLEVTRSDRRVRRSSGALSVGVLNSEGTLILELLDAERTLNDEDEEHARFIAAQLALVVSRLHDREKLLRERTRLEVLAGVSSALRAAGTLAELAQTAAQYALRATNGSTTMVLLSSPARDLLHFGAVAGVNADMVLASHVVTRERGLSWRVLDSGQPRIEDIAMRLPEAHTVRPLAQGAYIGIPIFDAEGAARRTIGVLTADTQADGGRFTAADLDCLTAIAESYTSARARLHALEVAQQRADAYARLALLGADLELLDDELDIAQRGMQGLLEVPGLEAAAYFTLHGATLRARASLGPLPEEFLAQREATPLELGKGIFGIALETARVQIVEQYGSDARSQGAFVHYNFHNSVVAPITLGGAVRGFIGATGFNPAVALGPNTLEIAEFIVRRVSRAMERAEQTGEILATRAASFRALGLALEVRDFETKGHTDRVLGLCLDLGRSLGLDAQQMQYLEWGALLHDIGKLAVPDEILLKPGKLTPEEWATIREHPETGYRMLEGLDFLPVETLEVVRHHQERLDGSGYPERRAGEDIPYLARLFAVVDVFDALISERPYKCAWTKAAALEELRAQAGVTLDAALVAAFIRVLETHAPTVAV